MLEKTYFFGAARDIEDLEAENRKKPATCPFAPGDVIYYYEPGNRTGKIGRVNGWHYDDNGRVKVSITLTATGEEIDAPLNRVRC